jgi:predicted TIM-barrel fold metal-dependent hydrolase
MYNGQKVIDVHGHMSTPPHFRAYAYNLIALRTPGEGTLEMSDKLMQEALARHLRMLDEREIDVQMISARPVAMMHWEAEFLVQKWSRVTNDVIHRQCQLHPDRFRGIAQLPQNSQVDTRNCLPELERCIQELGFVGALLNPDPGGDRRTPGMNKEYWFPLYEAAQALQAPLIVHPSISRDPRIEVIPSNFQYNNVTEETLATLLLEHSDVFDRFPNLRVIICHCGGALRRSLVKGSRVLVRMGDSGWRQEVVGASGEAAGGQVGMAIQRDEEPDERDVSNNLFFDTCAYDKAFLATAILQRGADRMLFGTEVPGTGSSLMNPETGKPSDDLIPVFDSIEFLSTEDKMKILGRNARRLFPLLKVD